MLALLQNEHEDDEAVGDVEEPQEYVFVDGHDEGKDYPVDETKKRTPSAAPRRDRSAGPSKKIKSFVIVDALGLE